MIFPAFTSSSASCAIQYSLELTNAPNNYVPLTAANFPVLSTIFSFDPDTRTLTVGTTSDTTLAKTYYLRMKAKLLSGSSVQYSTCEVTLLASTNPPINDCAGVTVTPTSMVLDVKFELKSSSDVLGNLGGLFAVNPPGSLSTCISFALYDTANLATTPPSGITFDSITPAITIQSTYYEALGAVAEKVYSFNLAATANSVT
jgi:hypothetical protein